MTAPAQQFQNECKVVAWLQSELKRVLDLIGTHGNPQPAQVAPHPPAPIHPVCFMHAYMHACFLQTFAHACMLACMLHDPPAGAAC